MSKKLAKKIAKKLETLQELLDKFEEVRAIDLDDPETWDSDTLYNLVEELKAALALLEDKLSKQKDDYGQPIVLEEGICSLVDSYQADEEESEEDI